MQWPWPSTCLPHGMTSRSLTSSNKHTDQHASVALGPLRPVLLSRRPSLPPAGVLACLLAVCVQPAGRPCGRGARVLSGLQAERMSGFVSCGLHPCFLSRRRRSITWHAAAGRLKGKSYGLPAKFSVQTVAISASACSRKAAVSRANCPSGQSSVEWINIQIELRKS